MDPRMTAIPGLTVVEDGSALSCAAADLVVTSARRAVAARGVFHLALSGGSTPRATYEMLASQEYQSRIPWQATQVWFSDERFVPLDSDQSNYHMAWESLLRWVPIPERFVHAVSTVGVTPDESATLYAQGIRRAFEVGEPLVPRFDLILLGLGPDGHTASLFPGTEALSAQDEIVVPNHVPALDAWRITFTYPLLNAARYVAFLVEGDGKAEVLRAVLAGEKLPAAGVRPGEGTLLWLADRAAASRVAT
jgi:6-phosphogluconolactonase